MINDLNWDSQFFRKKIGSINVDGKIKLSDFISCLNRFSPKYDCFYINIEGHRKEIIDYCNRQKIFLAVKKNVFKKKTTQRSLNNENIDFNVYISQASEIISLAGQLAKKSRFYSDPRFRPEAEKLYKTWFLNSIFRKHADKYFASIKEKRVIGFISLKSKLEDLYIDLFVVDKDHRRKGIGSALLKKAENWAFKKGYQTLKVATQDKNIASIATYQKLGYFPSQTIYVYHLWKKT